MYRTSTWSSYDVLQGGSGDDSGMGDSSNCSTSCSSSSDSCSVPMAAVAAAAAAGPTDFAAMMSGNSSDKSDSPKGLNREMASMRIKRKLSENVRLGEIMALEEEEEEEGIEMEEDVDENAQDCDASFIKMPPPALNRRVFGDISNKVESPVSSKRFSRHATIGNVSALSTGGLRNRNRKRFNQSPAVSPFGAQQGGKRWRVAESIDEHSEVASTSFAARTHSVADSMDKDEAVFAAPFARPSFHRVQSSSVLEKGRYAAHDENMPAHLDVKYRLPILAKVDSQAYRRIDGATLAELMRSMGEEFEKSYCLVDCRYPYEYEGGHIKGATNIFDPKFIDESFFTSETSLLERGERKRIPIFYCEFSQKRGPNMAAAVRAKDRVRNSTNYPKVDHEEMYVLNGGYNGFHESHGCEELCSAHSYTRMDAAEWSDELKKYMFHKKSFSACATVSRIPPPVGRDQQQQRRAELSGSPIAVQRRPSRRALYSDSPSRANASPVVARRPLMALPNPCFS